MGLFTFWDNSTREFDVDENDIINLAEKLNLSEYEFFCIAANRWGVALNRVHDDFKEYLWINAIPFYVSDWIRIQRIAPSPSC